MSNLGIVIKSISDKRAYKSLRLPNQLECLIISDKDAQKSSAALSVGVGSFSDPIQAQGLAHYLEHMLFMGTTKYPQQNQYSNFLSKNAGSSNAYTSLEETNFYFQVSHGAFNEALDRFSRFFIDPLMLDSSSQRQLNAVHSEHSKNLQSDPWRRYQLSKYLSKPDHPYHKFSTGDKSTLTSPNLRQMLFNFYNSNYSANLMKLVIYSNEDIELLAKSVEQKFNDVKNNQFKQFQIKEHPYGEKAINKVIKLIPVKDRRNLELTWILKDQSPYYKHPPAKYISHILGHQGKGSLLSFLISEGVATALSAGGSDSYKCYSEFQVNITLTDKGVSQFRDVIGYVLYFIKMLKETPPQDWVIQQIKRVNKMKFDFLEKKQGMSYCSGVAKNLHKRNLEQIFIYPYYMEEFKPDLINQYINQLTTDNLITSIESKTFQSECTQTEPIYQSKYTTEPIGNIQPIKCNVSLPQHNSFIPDDLTILPLGKQTLPKKLYQSSFIEAYFKEDHQFELPKAELNIRVYFRGQNNAKEDVIRTLFSKMLKQKLREFVYMAEMAELESQFSFSSYYTLNIKINGFRDSFDRFTNQYLKQILQYIPNDQQLFQTLREKQKKQYADYFLNNPYQIAYNTISSALRDGSSTPPAQKLEEIDAVTLQHLIIFSKNWKEKLYLQFFMTGNMTQAHGVSIAKKVQQFVQIHAKVLPKSSIGTIRSTLLPVGKVCAVQEILKSKNQTNNSIIVHYQYEAFNLKTKLFQQLANALVKEPAFDYLRTKQQLGYIVMCLQDDNRGVLGLSILIQSNVKNTYELQKYVSTFVNEILKEKIDTLDENGFSQYKNALYNTKIQKDKNLSAESTRFWGEIVKHSYQFSRKEKEIQTIPTITLQEFKKFLYALFYETTRIFEIHQISQADSQKIIQHRAERIKVNPNFQLFSDIETFRKKMPLHPDYYAHL